LDVFARDVQDSVRKVLPSPKGFAKAAILAFDWSNNDIKYVPKLRDELCDVLHNNYNFTIYKHTLNANKPQQEIIQKFGEKAMQINAQLTKGAGGPSLCVLYYTGHATKDKENPKQLWLQ
jgi:hypothetical protein